MLWLGIIVGGNRLVYVEMNLEMESSGNLVTYVDIASVMSPRGL